MTLSPPLMSRWCASVSRTAATLPAAYIALAVAAAFLGMVASLVLLPDSRGLWGAGLAALMVAIAAFDARLFIIPDELTAASLALGLAYAAQQDSDAWMLALGWAVLRGAAPALVFLAVRELYRRWRGRDGIGLGDVKLAAVAGVWLDWPVIPVAVDIAAVAALIAYLLLYLAYGSRPGFRRRIRRTTRLPFGLFLAPAIWLAWIVDTALPYSTMFSF
jgi:leader peptidase (prepilin peptidase) / N-methyltransferase